MVNIFCCPLSARSGTPILSSIIPLSISDRLQAIIRPASGKDPSKGQATRSYPAKYPAIFLLPRCPQRVLQILFCTHYPPTSNHQGNGDHDHLHGHSRSARPPTSPRATRLGLRGRRALPPFLPLPSDGRSNAAVLLPVWQDDAAELRAQVTPVGC